MLLIYPDSNSFHGLRRMTGTGAKQFLDSLRSDAVEVRLSPVVIAEVQRQEREAIAADCAKITKAVKDFARQFPRSDMAALTREAGTLTTSIQADDNALSPLVEHDACSITPYPSSTAEELVARELERRHPTMLKDSQSIGLRDQVIWDGCRELLRATQASGDRVVFVTKDKGFLNDSGGLHPDLLEDLNADGIDADRLTVVSSLPEATLEAEAYRELIDSVHVNIAIAATDYLSKLEGTRWEDSIGNLDDAPLMGIYDIPPVIHDIRIIEVDEVESGNPATVELYANITLRGTFWNWLSDDVAIGELELEGPDGGLFYTILKTSVLLTATVEYDEATDAAALDARVTSARFAWNW